MEILIISVLVIVGVVIMLVLSSWIQDAYYAMVRNYENERIYKRVYGLHKMGLIESGDLIMEAYGKKTIWWNNKIL